MGRTNINDEEYLRRQLTSQKALAERRRKDLIKLKAEIATFKAQAPFNDKLIVLLRLVRANTELLQELLDKRTETSKVDYDVKSPHIPS